MKTTNSLNDDSLTGGGNRPAASSGGKTAGQEICHPSVCVGGTTPSNCVCPTTAKK